MVAGLSASATAVAAIFGAWLWLDSHFAKQKDVMWMYSTLQQADIQMRIDWYESRIVNEKQEERPNPRIIRHLTSQIRRLEIRLKTLTDRESQ